MTCTRPHVGELFGAQGTFPPKLRDHDRPRLHQLFASFVAERNGPTPILIEALHSIDQVPVECVAAHLSIGEHVQPRTLLQLDGLVNRPVLERLELRMADLPFLITFTGVLQIRRAQQTSNNVASIHRTLLSTSFWERILVPPGDYVRADGDGIIAREFL